MVVASAVLPHTQAGEKYRPRQPSHAREEPVGFDLRLLESFVVLASELHFGRAAQMLAFAQPALSQQIRRLETQLGSSLFIRDSRKVELTAAGTAFLAHARVSLAAAGDAAAAVAATERATRGRLPLSVDGDALEHVRPLLRAFAVAHASVHLEVTLKYQDESFEALERQSVDASILRSGDRPPLGFEDTSTLVAASVAGVALRATHPLASLPNVAPDQLRGQRLVMFPRDRASDLYDLFLDGLGGAARFDVIDHIETIGQRVCADMLGALDDESVTPSPRWSGLPVSPQGFVWKPLVPAVPASLWLVWTRTASRTTRALAAFANRAPVTRETEAGLTLVPDL